MEPEPVCGVEPGGELRLPVPYGPVLHGDAFPSRPGVVCRTHLAGTALHHQLLGRGPTGRGAGDRNPLGPGARRGGLRHRAYHRHLDGTVGHARRRAASAVAAPAPRRRRANGITEEGSSQIGCGTGLHGRSERHCHSGHTAGGHTLAALEAAGTPAPGPGRVVDPVRGARHVLVGRSRRIAGKILVQLPSLHRDLGHDDQHGFSVRGVPGCVLLVELLLHTRTHLPRCVHAGDCVGCHPRQCRGRRPGSGRAGPSHSRAPVSRCHNDIRRSDHRHWVCRHLGRPVFARGADPPARETGPTEECLEVLARSDPTPGARPDLHGLERLVERGESST